MGAGQGEKEGDHFMSNSEYKIFGLREVSRPKGDGYLYLSFPGQSEGRPLVSFDLYKTSSEELKKILKEVLPGVLARENICCYELKNFSHESELVFHEVAAELGLVARQQGT